jgi:hypothetical protein
MICRVLLSPLKRTGRWSEDCSGGSRPSEQEGPGSIFKKDGLQFV